MPQDVRKEITITELRKGDRFAETGTPVTDVTRKQKWAIVELNGERTVRMQLDAPVTVLRIEAIDEEKEEFARNYVIKKLRNDLSSALTRDPAKLLGEIIAKAPTSDGEVLDWSNLPTVLHAQAMYKVALIICHLIHIAGVRLEKSIDVDLRANPDDVARVDPDVLFEAYAMWYYGNVDPDRSHQRSYDPLSRSTSPISNLLEDLDAWAIAQVVNDLMWTGALEEIKRRVAVMKAKHDED